MLKPALLYEDQLKQELIARWYDEKYMYYFVDYSETLSLQKGNWSEHSFVSVTDSGELAGFLSYTNNVYSNKATGLGAISFDEDGITFASDLIQLIRDMFEKFKFNKLEFGVVIGKPVEPHYDKLVQKLGGSIVGTSHQSIKLKVDGLLHDYKRYEILAENYHAYAEKER